MTTPAGGFRDPPQRRVTEKKFGAWNELPIRGRRYRCAVLSRWGWTARYFKEVDADENTVLRFWQDIYDERGVAVERHIKYPVDAGHERLEE